MHRLQRGFTLIELIIVITVIGVLAGITALGFSGYLADTRDAQRLSSVSAIAEGLEKYYDENGEYPNCSAVSADGDIVTNTTLRGIDAKSLVAPQAPDTTTNSLSCTILLANGTDFFEYEGDGSAACTGTSACLRYTLKYKQESSGTIKTLESRRQADIATSGNITSLVATAFNFSEVNLNWAGSGGAASYNVQAALNNTFTTGLQSSTVIPTSTTISGLSLGTLYFFRVQPVSSSGGLGSWSNSASATTFTLGTPVCTASTVPAFPASQLQCAWGAITHATSYTLQYSTNNTFPGGSTTVVLNATSPHVVTGLAAGTTLYFQVRAVASGFTSGWSATASAITQIPTPVCTSSTVNSNTQITVTWGSVASAATYTLSRATNAGFSGASEITGITGTSRVTTGLSNATTYFFRVKAVNGVNESTWGACPSATTGINGPTGAGWYAEPEAVRARAGLPWMPGQDPGYGTSFWTNGMTIYGTCSPGATVVTRLYSYYAYSNNTGANNASLMDWTFGNQTRYVVNGASPWTVWWQGWVACQAGGTRVGDTYLGNAGPY